MNNTKYHTVGTIPKSNKKYAKIIWLSNLSILSVPDEGY